MRVFAFSKDDYYYTTNGTMYHKREKIIYQIIPDRALLVWISRNCEKGVMYEIDTPTNKVHQDVTLWFSMSKRPT